MKNTVTNITPSKVKLTVEVDEKTWKEAQEKAFNKVSAKVVVKGFRPGKAPKQLLKEHTNPADVFDEAVNSMLNPAYIQALEETKINPFMSPSVNVTKVSDSELTLEYVVVLVPKCELGEYKGLEAPKAAPRVSAKEVDEAIARRLSANASWALVEREAKMGDTVVFDFLGKTENEKGEMVAFDGGAADNYSLELGSNQFVPGFEAGLVGVKAGDEKNIDITFPEAYVKELAGKKAVFSCKIHEVKEKQVPELTDEAVEELALKDKGEEIKTVDALKAYEKATILEGKVNKAQSDFFEAILAKIVEGAKFEIADEIIHQEAHANLDNLRKQVEQNGLTFEQYLDITGNKEETLHAQFHEQAEKNIKAFLALNEIARAEKIEVSDEDLDKQAGEMAEHYGIKKEDVIKYLKNDEERWKAQIRDNKIRDFILSVSKVASSAKKAE